MNCTTFEAWLQDTADERQRALSRDAAAHLADCAACCVRWSEERHLDEAIVAWHRLPVPAVSADAAFTKLLEQQTLHAPHAQRIVVARSASTRLAGATVATALAVLIITGLALRQNGPRPETPIVQQTVPEQDNTPVSDSLAALWTEVRSSSRAAAEDAVESLDQWSQLPSPPMAIAPVETPRAPAATPWLPWSEPIGENVNSAFGFLGDVLPMPAAG